MKKDKGLTLIELIVSLGLLMLILFSVASFIKPIIGTYGIDMSAHSTMELNNSISNQISKELRIINSVQIFEYSESKVRSVDNCFYVNEDGYIMVKRNGKTPELLYPSDFYGDYTVNLGFEILSNKSSMILEINIYDKNQKIIDSSETGIELINVNEDSVVFESSNRQLLVFE